MSVQTTSQNQELQIFQSNLDINTVAGPPFSHMVMSHSEAFVYERGDSQIKLDTATDRTDYFEVDSSSLIILKTGNFKINFSIYINTMGDGNSNEEIVIYLKSQNLETVAQLYTNMNNLSATSFTIIKILSLTEGDVITAHINCIQARAIADGGQLSFAPRLEITTY